MIGSTVAVDVKRRWPRLRRPGNLGKCGETSTAETSIAEATRATVTMGSNRLRAPGTVSRWLDRVDEESCDGDELARSTLSRCRRRRTYNGPAIRLTTGTPRSAEGCVGRYAVSVNWNGVALSSVDDRTLLRVNARANATSR